MNRNLFKLFIFTAGVITMLMLINFSLQASPVVINDNRMEHLNGFPSIGRGYSMRSNRLQSMCLKSVKKTKPSFDLIYDIEDVTADYLTNITISSKDRLKNSRLNSFIKKYYKDEEKDEFERTLVLKNLIVRVEVNTYYYALDETRSPLSNSARYLLEQKQYVTFFNSCGHHYVRSVGTYATYYALLQYRMRGEPKTDEIFQNRLEKGLFNFHGGKSKKGDTKFKEDAQFRGLRVYVQGIGLSKGNMVNLIPINIDQFRITVQDAVKLMQDPNAGVITRMEVAPWVENPEISSFLTKKGSTGDQQFSRMLRLEANSGVIAEINRISNDQIEQFHIASLCHNILTKNYVDKSNKSFYKSYLPAGGKKETSILLLTDLIQQKLVAYDPDKTLFYNLANENDPATYVTLRDFINYFVKHPPEKLFEINKKYLYGNPKDPEGEPGALSCIDEIYKKGLDKTDYRRIDACKEALIPKQADVLFLEQYCLPKPYRLVFKGKKKKKKRRRRKRKTTGKDKTVEGPIESLEDMIKGRKGQKGTEDNKDNKDKKDKKDAKKPIESLEDLMKPVKKDGKEKKEIKGKKETKKKTKDEKKDTTELNKLEDLMKMNESIMKEKKD